MPCILYKQWRIFMSLNDWNELNTGLLKHGFDCFYDTLLSRANSSSEVFQSLFNHDTPQSVCTVFLRDKTVNATAKLENNKYYIGINAALPCIIHFTFNMLLRTPYYFPKLGDRNDYDDEYRQFPNGIPLSLPNDVPIEDALWGIVSTSRPSSDKRAVAATLLTEIAMSFCVYHELAHIQTGHVISAKEMLDEKEFLELSAITRSVADRKIFRVWEYEADKLSSIMLSANDMLDENNQKHFCEAFEIDRDNDIYKLFGVILSSLYVLFHLFNQMIPGFKSASNHPHPTLRYSYVSSEIVNFISRHFNYSIKETKKFKKDITQFVIMTQTAWLELGLPIPVDITSKSFHKWALKRIDKLEYNRKNLNGLYLHRAWVYPFSE